MSEWKEYTLEDLAEILNHKRIPLSSMQRSKRRGTFPYYGASGVIDFVDDYIFDGEHVLISEDGENLKSRQTPIAFIADGKFWVNNHAHIIKGKKEYFNRLIVYYFENLDLNPFLTGAVQPKLNKAALTSIPIYLPESESEQKAIVEVLSSLDDKIDLLHRQNKTLEQLAETLFRQWFVEEAEESWVIGKLDDIAVFNNGKSRPKEVEYGKIPIYGGNGILGYTDQFNYDGISIIIGRVGAYCGSLYIEDRPIWLSDNALISRSKQETDLFLFYLLKTLELNSMAEGSSHPLLTQTLLKSIDIVIPPDKMINEFDNQAREYWGKIIANSNQIKTLEQIRDALLPKLMNGEVRVDLTDSLVSKPVKSKMTR